MVFFSPKAGIFFWGYLDFPFFGHHRVSPWGAGGQPPSILKGKKVYEEITFAAEGAKKNLGKCVGFFFGRKKIAAFGGKKVISLYTFFPFKMLGGVAPSAPHGENLRM